LEKLSFKTTITLERWNTKKMPLKTIQTMLNSVKI